jgi:hypothetical protein
MGFILTSLRSALFQRTAPYQPLQFWQSRMRASVASSDSTLLAKASKIKKVLPVSEMAKRYQKGELRQQIA